MNLIEREELKENHAAAAPGAGRTSRSRRLLRRLLSFGVGGHREEIEGRP